MPDCMTQLQACVFVGRRLIRATVAYKKEPDIPFPARSSILQGEVLLAW